MWYREEGIATYCTFIKGIWGPGDIATDNNGMATAWFDPTALYQASP